jgi:hypothetical protein
MNQFEGKIHGRANWTSGGVVPCSTAHIRKLNLKNTNAIQEKCEDYERR